MDMLGVKIHKGWNHGKRPSGHQMTTRMQQRVSCFLSCHSLNFLPFYFATEVRYSNITLFFNNFIFIIHYRPKVWNIRKTQWKLSHLKFWFTANGLAPTTHKYGDFNVTPMCSVMDDKCNLLCPEKRLRNLQKCIFFDISPKISHSFHGIQHYMVNLWKYCVYSIVFATDITQNLWWVDGKQFGCKIKVAGRCDSRYSILSFGAITKLCFIFVNHIYLGQGFTSS